MGKVILGLWAAVILFAGFWFGYYQEGANRDITLETEGSLSMSVPFRMKVEITKIYMAGNKLAIDLDVKSGVGKCRMIADFDENESLFVLLDKKKYAQSEFSLVPKSECEPAEAISRTGDEDLKRLPDTATLAGQYRCHAFTPADGKAKDAKLWFTYEIRLGRDHVNLLNKVMRMKGEEGMGFAGLTAGGGANSKPKQVTSFEYFPIPLRVEGVTGPVSFDVKDISRDKIDRSVFKPPSGCQKISEQELQNELVGGFRLQ